MVNMKDIAVCYDKISAFDMLVDIAKITGIESIQAALDEIAAQQMRAADVGESEPKCTTEKLCPVHNVWHAKPPRG
jgi:hypothetical protein